MDSNEGNLQEWSIATTAAVTALAFVAVCLRLLARYERKQALWWDDWLIIFSMGWNIVVVGFIYAMIDAGMGLHADTLEPANIVRIAKLLLVAEILYVWNLVWTKLSLLMLFYRIFHFAYFRRWAYLIGGFVIAWGVCITFLFVFICVPVQKVWYPEMPGRCINQVGTWIANAVSTLLTDLAILLLPLPQVWKLQLRMLEKVALTVIFGLGFFVVFASAYRLTVLFSYTPLDSSYTLAPTVGWTAIEMSAGIVSACLPTHRPALHFFARVFGFGAVMPTILRNRSAGVSKSAGPSAGMGLGMGLGNGNTNGSGKNNTNGSGARLNQAKAGSDAFYQLPDDTEVETEMGTGMGTMFSRTSDEHDHDHGNDNIPLDAALRPRHGHVYTVTSCAPGAGAGARGPGESGSLSGGDADGDEVPLHGIRVQKDFRQEANY